MTAASDYLNRPVRTLEVVQVTLVREVWNGEVKYSKDYGHEPDPKLHDRLGAKPERINLTPSEGMLNLDALKALAINGKLKGQQK